MLYNQQRVAYNRLRIVKDTLIVGSNTVLAERLSKNGCWQARRLDDTALAATLIKAYDSRNINHNALLRTALRVVDLMTADPERAAPLLAALPDPLPDCAERLAQPENSVQARNAREMSGTTAFAFPAPSVVLPPAPSYSARLALCDSGVVLGKGTIVAALNGTAHRPAGLTIEGYEERILALLSLASGALVGGEVLGKFSAASRALGRGDLSLASIHLCHVRIPPLPGEGLAKALALAASDIDAGTAPFALLKGVDLLPEGAGHEDWRALTKFNPNHRPAGTPDGGQFCSPGEASDTAAVTPVRMFGRTPPGVRTPPQTNHDAPEQVRQTLEAIAGGYQGDSRWGVSGAHENFKSGSYKCNLFIADVLKEAGIPVGQLHDTYFHETIPTAGDWANRDFNIPGWIVLPPGTKPQPGDVVAEHHFWADLIGTATGHVGIMVTSKAGSIESASVSSKTGKVEITGWGTTAGPNFTVRRYVGGQDRPT